MSTGAVSFASTFLASRSAGIVENNLGIVDFINSQKRVIYEKLESSYGEAKLNVHPEADFRSLTAPLVSGIIHVGSSLDGYRKAVERTNEVFPGADYVIVLCKVVLTYLVCKGFEEFSQARDEEKRVMWGEMVAWLGQSE